MTDRVPYAIDCPYCEDQFSMEGTSPLTRLEAIEYHRRKLCIKDELGIKAFKL